jgi:sialate O-acetylesterase
MRIESKGTEQLCLHTMVSDGMVLQRNADVKIWGWAGQGNKVSVRFLDSFYATVADSNGEWTVALKTHEAGGPYEMEVISDKVIVLHDILIGDVWVCGGQSNMQLPMERVKDKYADAVANDENPLIRQFIVPEHYEFKTPCKNTEVSKWESVSHDTILDFSAVGYFFAKQLYEKYSVPIGLIKTAIGGSHIEAWMSRDSLKEFPEMLKIADQFSDDRYVKCLTQSEDDREKQWYDTLNKNDQGLHSGELPWYDEKYDDSKWPSMQIPSYWTDEGLEIENGAFWFRKEITLKASLAGLPARIFMGRIVDADYVYINGTLVGTTSYQYPPRKYDIPAGLLKEGKNTIAVRVISNRGKGGFITEKPYQLRFKDQFIDLSGKWKYHAGASARMLCERNFLHDKPVGLFNGMLSPILNYSIKGVIWYQGESNTPHPENYEELFAGMINEWRKQWKKDDLPFLYVQLPNYLERENPQAIGKWPLLREAQLKTLKVPHTAMIVTIDIGEWNDLHPLNKLDLAKRLALAARKLAYGDESAVPMGPIYRSMEIQGNKAILNFTNIGTGLVSKGCEKLNNFEIAGENGIFYSADAYIENNQAAVSCEQISLPVAVRYAWSDSPKNINFYNKEGLPASPFRTANNSDII